jgi:hypothetical protein
MFGGEAGAYPSEPPPRCSPQGWAPGIAHNQHTRLERLACSEHSSLLQKFTTYGCKKITTLAHDLTYCYEIFYARSLQFFVIN